MPMAFRRVNGTLRPRACVSMAALLRFSLLHQESTRRESGRDTRATDS